MIIFFHYPYFTSAYVTYTSIYVSIYGVVFATGMHTMPLLSYSPSDRSSTIVWASNSTPRPGGLSAPNHSISYSTGSKSTRYGVDTLKLGSPGLRSSTGGSPGYQHEFKAPPSSYTTSSSEVKPDDRWQEEVLELGPMPPTPLIPNRGPPVAVKVE
jgi:hypothetical protein